MSTNLEIEFKNLLNKQEYEQLLHFFAIEPSQLTTQKNLYFDTPTKALQHLRAALRIRLKGESYELTLKTKDPHGALETNQSLTKEAYQALVSGQSFTKGPVYDTLMNLNVSVSQLHLIADLTTKRVEFPYKEGTLFLDQSFYGNLMDYELEYEALDYNNGLKTFNEFLTQHQIPTRPASPKIKRAQDALEKV